MAENCKYNVSTARELEGVTGRALSKEEMNGKFDENANLATTICPLKEICYDSSIFCQLS